MYIKDACENTQKYSGVGCDSYWQNSSLTRWVSYMSLSTTMQGNMFGAISPSVDSSVHLSVTAASYHLDDAQCNVVSLAVMSVSSMGYRLAKHQNVALI